LALALALVLLLLLLLLLVVVALLVLALVLLPLSRIPPRRPVRVGGAGATSCCVASARLLVVLLLLVVVVLLVLLLLLLVVVVVLLLVLLLLLLVLVLLLLLLVVVVVLLLLLVLLCVDIDSSLLPLRAIQLPTRDIIGTDAAALAVPMVLAVLVLLVVGLVAALLEFPSAVEEEAWLLLLLGGLVKAPSMVRAVPSARSRTCIVLLITKMNTYHNQQQSTTSQFLQTDE
jgi:hypothetical protein